VAVILTGVEALTKLVVTGKLTLECQAGTITLAGTAATAGLLLDRATKAPPSRVAAPRIARPVDTVPPVTLAGSRVKDESSKGGRHTMSSSEIATPPLAAVILTNAAPIWGGSTGFVDIVKLALIAPGATITLAGRVAAQVMLLERLTTAPPAGAGTLSVTVPVDAFPGVTPPGLKLREERVVGTSSRTADLVSPR
jgi:hypothetical protein